MNGDAAGPVAAGVAPTPPERGAMGEAAIIADRSRQRWWRRFWPESLGAQLAIVTLGAALLAQLLTFLILADERRFVVEGLRRDQVLSRIVGAIDLIAATPPELHEQVLRAAGTAQARLWLSDRPLVERNDDTAPDRVRRILVEALGNRVREVRLNRELRPPQRWWPWSVAEEASRDQRNAESPPARRHGGPRAGGPRGQIEVSLLLNDRRWLNARSQVPPPPLLPGVWAVVSSLTTAAAAVLVAILMLRRLVRPLRALADAADRLGRGEPPPVLPRGGPAEVQRTTDAFAAMAERLRRFVDDRTRLLAAIGHDLRTPITSLRLRAELMDDSSTRTKLLETIDEMQRMVEATLTFTGEAASAESTREVDLAALVEAVSSDLADLGLEVTVEPAERAVLPCRPAALRRALRNLIENAVRYGARARVRLDRGPGRELRIIVEDDGPGIPAAELERVFEPFYRLERSRSAATGGIGLGLAIARGIARAHGGDVLLANLTPRGLRATLRLPEPQVPSSGT